MKPLNLDNSPCTPISSNCVIWQGPNIPCIKLCTGDTVSDVVFKLATELCTILETLDINNYDLACLNLAGCDPKDFQALIQLLITKICELENIPTPAPTPGGSGCPTDCIVGVAQCFQDDGAPAADYLLNYVDLIANKVCDLASRIDVIENSLLPNGLIGGSIISLQSQVNDLVANPYELPPITHSCQIGIYLAGTSQPLDSLFQAFIEDWCDYIATASSPTDLLPVLNPACTLTGSAYFGPDSPKTDPAWIPAPANLADAISNIWTSICFLYNYNYAQTVVTGSGDIVVTPSYNAGTNTTTYDVSIAATAAFPVGAVIPWAGIGGSAPAGWLFCDGGIYDPVANPQYQPLFAVISSTYGGGGGNFRVPNLQYSIPIGPGPDVSGYNFASIGDTGGDIDITLTAAETPAHTHGLATATVGGTITAPVTATVTGTASGTTDGGYADLTTATDESSDETRIMVGAENNLTLDDHRQQTTHTHTFTGTVTGTATGTATGPFTGTISGDTDDGSPALQGQAHGNMQPYVVMRYIIKY